MENGKNKLISLQFLGIALIAVGFVLTPLNDGFFLFIKRALFVVGYVLCMVSGVFYLIQKRGQFADFLSGIFHDSRLVGLFVFQVIGGLIACVILDGSYFVLFFGGACFGSLVWLLFAKK